MGPGPSEMAEFARRRVSPAAPGERFLELGCGNGRDLSVFLDLGYQVAAVDLSVPAVRIARARSLRWKRPEGVPRPIIDSGDALEFLRTQPDGSATVVYSHLFFSMATTGPTLTSLRREVARVLRPGGLHLFSVRTLKDRWCGRGREIGENTWALEPAGPPVRFFDPRRLGQRGFETLEVREGTEESGPARRRVAYVALQKK